MQNDVINKFPPSKGRTGEKSQLNGTPNCKVIEWSSFLPRNLVL